MRKTTKKLLTGMLIIGFVSMFAGFAIGGDITIVGTVNDEYQIVDDAGTVYDVEDNEKGEEIVEHVGQKIQVKGTVMEDEDGKMITITSFTVMEE
jgi:hypothetical protein